MRNRIKVLSVILSMIITVTNLMSMYIFAAELSIGGISASDLEGERTNITYLEGKPGDTHLIYSYEQNGNIFKVVESSTDDFECVESHIFQLNEQGEYIENSIQQVTIGDNGNPEIVIFSSDGDVEWRTIDITHMEVDGSSVCVENWEWITQYYDGSRGGLKGLAISALISVISAIATYYSAGALTAGVVAGASTIASALFAQNAEKVYYHTIYNWRHSPKSYFVIDETEWTEFFIDSSHIYSLGYTYDEWIY